MGKRTIGLTGVSRFVLDAFKDPTNALESRTELPEPSFPFVGRDGNARPVEQEETNERPAKKRKIALLAKEWEHYDASGLVTHYTHASQVPENLQKYFSQRKRYFSMYDQGCLLDEEGWYSVTPERVADQIAERCRCTTILDAFCGVGGNAIAFAKTCERVIALDTSPVRLALARHNAIIYGVADRIEFILADYLSFSQSYLSLPSHQQSRKIDVVFLSPPWGGPSYLSGSPAEALAATSVKPGDAAQEAPVPVEAHPEYHLADIQPIHGAELFALSRRLTPNIAYFLPRNTNLTEISDLVRVEGADHQGDKTEREEAVEVEEEWMGTKLKALTCYFGGLVAGQEDMF